MKKITVLVSLLCLMGVSSFAVKPNGSTATNDSAISIATPQDYCPKGYICEATNCTAKRYYGAPSKDLTGISVYKNSNGDVIAYVPDHGHLRCSWRNSGGLTGWWFDANSGSYLIIGYTRKQVKHHLARNKAEPVFEEDGMGLNRLDFGVRIGVSALWQQIVFGIGYEHGLIDITDWEGNVKTSNIFISIGYKF